jgi:2-methylisocitrate lyase-like PEP mutase family enzyme
MTSTTNTSSFKAFRALHETGLLRLPNAWDAGSARLIESLGAKAIATTSAGLAWTAGYPDGNQLPRSLVLSISEGIARVVRVPLSIDIEGGYSSDPAQVADLVVRLAERGIIGINLEDGSGSAELLAHKISAAKDALAQAGLALFINARTDVYLAGLVEASRRVDETLRRSSLYASAGADGLFVPAIVSLQEIAEVARRATLPLNVLSWKGLATPVELEAVGVRRLSAGSGISARVWAQAALKVRRFLDEGELLGDPMPYSDLQSLFGQ